MISEIIFLTCVCVLAFVIVYLIHSYNVSEGFYDKHPFRKRRNIVTAAKTKMAFSLFEGYISSRLIAFRNEWNARYNENPSNPNLIAERDKAWVKLIESIRDYVNNGLMEEGYNRLDIDYFVVEQWAYNLIYGKQSVV